MLRVVMPIECSQKAGSEHLSVTKALYGKPAFPLTQHLPRPDRQIFQRELITVFDARLQLTAYDYTEKFGTPTPANVFILCNMVTLSVLSPFPLSLAPNLSQLVASKKSSASSTFHDPQIVLPLPRPVQMGTSRSAQHRASKSALMSTAARLNPSFGELILTF